MKKITLILLISFLIGCQETVKPEIEDSINTSDNEIELTDSITVSEQVFNIQNKADTLILLNGGIKIFIPANSFTDDNQNDFTDISVEFKECVNKSDMILESLSTSSDSNMLITNGMVKITAYYEDTKLMLKNKSEIKIYFPRNNNSEKYDLFYGKINGINVNWIKDDTKPEQDIVKKRKRKIQQQFNYSYRISGRTIKINNDFIPTYMFEDKSINNDFFQFLKKNFKPSKAALKELYAFYESSPKDDLSSFSIRVEINFDQKINVSSIDFSNPELIISKELSTFIKNSLPRIDYSTVDYHDIRHNKPNFGFNIYGSRELDKKNFTRKFEEQEITKSTDEDLEYYTYSISNLGWINCDRFYKYEDVITQSITLKNQDLEYSLVFKDINSILKGIKNKNELYFNKIPPNQNVTLIGYKIKNDSIIYCCESFSTSKVNYSLIKENVISFNEFKTEIKKLNN